MVNSAEYISISFSDLLGLLVSYKLPSSLDRCLTPQTKPSYKIPPNVVKDEIFQTRLSDSMTGWLQVKADGADLLTWWEYLIKGGVRQLAQTRGKELKNQRLGQLNILKSGRHT